MYRAIQIIIIFFAIVNFIGCVADEDSRSKEIYGYLGFSLMALLIISEAVRGR